MPIKLNLVILSGNFSCKDKRKLTSSGTYDFYSNRIRISAHNVNIIIANHIRFLLCEKNINTLVTKWIEEQYCIEVGKLYLKVTNIHHSASYAYGCKNILDKFVPAIENSFGIKDTKITQDCFLGPEPTRVSELIGKPNISFAALFLSLEGGGASIKLQTNKAKTKTHVTVILTDWSQNSQNLINFLERPTECLFN